MDVPIPELILLVFLTLLNGFFTGSEIAFVSLREGQLQRLEEAGERGRKVAAMAREPNRFLSTVQIFITLAGFFASAVAARTLADPFAGVLDDYMSPGLASTIAVVTITLILSYFTLVFGELAPKRVAMQRAEGWAHFAVTPLRWCAEVARPAIWVLDKSTNLVVRMTGGDPEQQREEVTEEEIRDLLEAQDTFSDDQRSIINGAFEIAERTLREIVVPRGSVLSVGDDEKAVDALRTLAEAGHSRAPVHSGDLDDVLGIVHVRDLIHSEKHEMVTSRTRPATVLPESLGVLDALRRLQGSHQQMALVVNEHGGVEGIITVEDLLEEIVGEIYDEFDRDVAEVVTSEDGTVTLPGSFPIHDLEDVNVELPEGEGAYATIAGYVLSVLGHIPGPGEIAKGERWDVEVLAVEDRAITQVKLIPVGEAVDAENVPTL